MIPFNLAFANSFSLSFIHTYTHTIKKKEAVLSINKKKSNRNHRKFFEEF